MATPLERSRSGCALHGALFAAAAVRGMVPILHTTAGCGFQGYRLGLAGGGCSPDPAGGLATASTNIFEKQVVFGGTARLREQIKNAVKVLDGAWPVVLSGCATEMVGDDIPAMVRESREQGEGTIAVATAGFRGSAYAGYAAFLTGVIAQLDETAPPRRGGMVNILGLVPRQDPFWEGDLDELTRLLAAVGLSANTVFGLDGGIDGLRSLGAAGISLVLSPWGLKPARELERRFGVPWFDAGGLPVGAAASAVLLHALAERLGLERGAVETVAEAECRRERHYLARLADAYYRHDFQRDVALVAGSAYAAGLAGFLTDTLGWLPRLVAVTDDAPPDARAAVDHALAPLVARFGTQVVHSDDAATIADAVLKASPDIVLASALEREAAGTLAAPLVEVSFPVAGRTVLDRGLAGPRGALGLVDEALRSIRQAGAGG